MTCYIKFVAYYTKGDKVVAVARSVHLRRTLLYASLITAFSVSMQADPMVAKCSELMRLGVMPTASEIRAGKVRIMGQDGIGLTHTLSVGPIGNRYLV